MLYFFLVALNFKISFCIRFKLKELYNQKKVNSGQNMNSPSSQELQCWNYIEPELEMFENIRLVFEILCFTYSRREYW